MVMPLPDFSKTGLLGGYVAGQDQQKKDKTFEQVTQARDLELKQKAMETSDYEYSTGARRAKTDLEEAMAKTEIGMEPKRKELEAATYGLDMDKTRILQDTLNMEQDARYLYGVNADNYGEAYRNIPTSLKENLGLTGNWGNDGQAVHTYLRNAVNDIDMQRLRIRQDINAQYKATAGTPEASGTTPVKFKMDKLALESNAIMFKRDPLLKNLSSKDLGVYAIDYTQIYNDLLTTAYTNWKLNGGPQPQPIEIGGKLRNIMDRHVHDGGGLFSWATGMEYDSVGARNEISNALGIPATNRGVTVNDDGSFNYPKPPSGDTQPKVEPPKGVQVDIEANSDIIDGYRKMYGEQLSKYTDSQVLNMAKEAGVKLKEPGQQSVAKKEPVEQPASTNNTKKEPKYNRHEYNRHGRGSGSGIKKEQVVAKEEPKYKTRGESRVADIKKGQKAAADVTSEMEDWMYDGKLEVGRRQIDRWIKKLQPYTESGDVTKLIRRLEKYRKSARRD